MEKYINEVVNIALAVLVIGFILSALGFNL